MTIKLSNKQLRGLIKEVFEDTIQSNKTQDDCIELVANHVFDALIQTTFTESNDSLNDDIKNYVVDQLDKSFSLEEIGIDYDRSPEITNRVITMLVSSPEFRTWINERIEASLKSMY